MNESEREDLAVRLTRRIIEVPGVRGIYPQSVVAALVGQLVRSDQSAATGLVQIRSDDELIHVAARLATNSSVPTHEVIAAVCTALEIDLTDQFFNLDIQIAHID